MQRGLTPGLLAAQNRKDAPAQDAVDARPELEPASGASSAAPSSSVSSIPAAAEPPSLDEQDDRWGEEFDLEDDAASGAPAPKRRKLRKRRAEPWVRSEDDALRRLYSKFAAPADGEADDDDGGGGAATASSDPFERLAEERIFQVGGVRSRAWPASVALIPVRLLSTQGSEADGPSAAATRDAFGNPGRRCRHGT